MKTLILISAVLTAAWFANAGETKEKVKAAAHAIKDDAKDIFKTVGTETKAAAKKVKAKIHEKTK
jgi:hypothetical protein